MPISSFDYYQDFSALPLGDFTDADFTSFDGAALDIVNVSGTNALDNDPADSTNVIRLGYTAEDHASVASVGVSRAYPNDGSDQTLALTLGSSGAGYNFSSSLGTENCYAVRWLNTSITMYRIENGSATSVPNDGGGSVNLQETDGAELVLEMVDSGADRIVSAYVDDVLQFQYTDTSPLTLSGGVASVSFKGQSNYNSAIYGFAVDGLVVIGPSLTAADDVTSENNTFSFTLSGNVGEPSAVRINGEAGSNIQSLGGGVYSYTSPLTADDATATLEVDVDSTTVDTTIAYTNSYPYALTAHAEPDANSIMFGNQFGTTEPVELKIISDTNPSYVTIDWAAMDAAQDWTADIENHATYVADGTTSVTIGYFITETGQTGSFTRTLEVGAGGVIIVTYLGPRGNMNRIRRAAAEGITNGSANLRDIKYWQTQGATSSQYNTAQHQAGEIL